MDLKTSGVKSVVIGTLTDGNPLANDLHPKRRSDLNYRTIDGEPAILDRQEGNLHQLNPTARFIWHCCGGNSNVAAIIAPLADAYEVASSTARKGGGETLRSLGSSSP